MHLFTKPYIDSWLRQLLFAGFPVHITLTKRWIWSEIVIAYDFTSCRRLRKKTMTVCTRLSSRISPSKLKVYAILIALRWCTSNYVVLFSITDVWLCPASAGASHQHVTLLMDSSSLPSGAIPHCWHEELPDYSPGTIMMMRCNELTTLETRLLSIARRSSWLGSPTVRPDG